MQNDERPIDIIRTPVATQPGPGQLVPNATPVATPVTVPVAPLPQVTTPTQTTSFARPQPPPIPPQHLVRQRRPWVLFTAIGVGAAGLLIGGIFWVSSLTSSSQNQTVKSGEFAVQQLPLSQLKTPDLSFDSASSLKINGQLQVTDSIVFTPSLQPTHPTIGQLYYDKTSNQLAYYNGQQFQNLATQGTTTTPTTTNITNVLGGATAASVTLQTSSPGVQQTGNFNISGTGTLGAVATSAITSNGGVLYVNPVSATAQQQVVVGTPAIAGLTSGSQNTGSGWNNTMSATKITMGSVGGTTNSIAVAFGGGSAASRVQVAIYDDDGGVPSKPAARLAQSAIVNLVPNGVTTATIPSITLSANATYWLAVKTDDVNVTRPFNSGSKMSCFVSSGFGFMPDPFSAPGCFSDDNQYVIYLNYTSGAGASGILSPAQMVLGINGQAVFQNTTDTTTAFQIQNATGTSTVFNVDTVNGRIAIGKTNASYKLDIAAGDINLSNGRSLRFGGQQALSMNSSGTTTVLSNFQSNGTVSVQADNFVVQDANATHQSIAMSSNGAMTFSNKTDTTAGFQIQNATGTVLFRADTSGLNLYVGNPAGSATPVILYLANKNTAGDPAGGAEGGTYYNSTLKTFRCFRNGFWQNCADIEPQHSFSFYDEFMGGGTSFTGQIGSLGWTAAAIGANGTLVRNPATPTPSADRPGVLQVQTPALANQGTTFLLADTTGGSVIIAKDNDVKTAVAVGAATGQVLRVGLHGETTSTTQPVSGVWWEANPAVNANWRYCYGDGATATCTATTVPIAANTWVTLEIRVTATGANTSAATFVINNTAASVSAVTIDTTNRVSPALTCYGTSGAAQDCNWDYFHFTGTTSSTR